MKKVLILGGSYFAGRVFAILAGRTGEYEFTFINRGRYSMSQIPASKEYKCDRHDMEMVSHLPAEDFDVCVDFCAYEPGDIKNFLNAYKGSMKQYIYISTADVYERANAEIKDETAPLLKEIPEGPAGDYMFKKAYLEGECKEICEEKGMKYTFLRPAFLYGPYNYAPRESFFIRLICAGQMIPVPFDSDSNFNFVYAPDLAKAIMLCIGNEVAYGKAYNVAAPEVQNYGTYVQTLIDVSDIKFETVVVSCEQVENENIPLPFPLYAKENEVFDGSLITRELGLEYTSFKEGMGKTYTAFKGVFTG